jgi:hypothetical protein
MFAGFINKGWPCSFFIAIPGMGSWQTILFRKGSGFQRAGFGRNQIGIAPDRTSMGETAVRN